jgi:hypothetical protein
MLPPSSQLCPRSRVDLVTEQIKADRRWGGSESEANRRTMQDLTAMRQRSMKHEEAIGNPKAITDSRICRDGANWSWKAVKGLISSGSSPS